MPVLQINPQTVQLLQFNSDSGFGYQPVKSKGLADRKGRDLHGDPAAGSVRAPAANPSPHSVRPWALSEVSPPSPSPLPLLPPPPPPPQARNCVLGRNCGPEHQGSAHLSSLHEAQLSTARHGRAKLTPASAAAAAAAAAESGEHGRNPLTGEGLLHAQHTGSAHLSGARGTGAFHHLKGRKARSTASKHANAEGRNVLTGTGEMETHESSAHLSWVGAPGSAGGATAGNHSLGGGRRRAQSVPRSWRGEGEHAGKSVWEQQASWRVAVKASKRAAAHAFSAGDLLTFDPENNPPPSSATGWATSSGCRHGRPHTGRKSFGHLHGGGGGRAGGGVFPEGEMSFETTSRVLGHATAGGEVQARSTVASQR